jgi:hypothetical protein
MEFTKELAKKYSNLMENALNLRINYAANKISRGEFLDSCRELLMSEINDYAESILIKASNREESTLEHLRNKLSPFINLSAMVLDNADQHMLYKQAEKCDTIAVKSYLNELS